MPRHRRGGGIPQVGRFPHRFILSESACCRIPQAKIRDFCQLPLAREPFCARYRSMVRYRAFSCFQSTAWDRNPNKIYIPKRGQGLKLRTRAKAKGQSSDGSTRGILKGGAIRAGASCSPLEPDNFPSFLAGARKEGPAGKRLQKADWRIDRKAVTGCRYLPASTTPKANRNCTARRLPQSPAVPAPDRRELWASAFSHWLVLLGKCQL